MTLSAQQRQINMSVPARVHQKLAEMAKSAGQSTSGYATTLFMAAYTARCKETGDRDLDDAVGRVILLWGTDFSIGAIAHHVGLSETTVRRILNAWRDEMIGVAA